MAPAAAPRTSPSRKALRQQWRDADHESRRRLIVDVAVALLDRRGLEAVTMRGVAAHLGVGAMTLYTYFRGQDELRRAMTQRGFELLSAGCEAASTLGTPQGWRGGARHYLQFALERRNLYQLMFATPRLPGEEGQDLLHKGFQPLVQHVREQMRETGLPQAEIDRTALPAAGRFWIALHGLASLAIADRLGVLGSDLDQLLDDLLTRVAPT